jgi:FtsP/CotA-like multicopper oxidase with cupredoxin domain
LTASRCEPSGARPRATARIDTFKIDTSKRVELAVTKQTVMPHPVHLHGQTSQVVAIDRVRFAGALRDTVLVPSKATVTVAFDTDNPGSWPIHCHLLSH